MIKIENVEVVGLEASIRGMRNPINSWEKSDDTNIIDATDKYLREKYDIGYDDFILMKRLAKCGTDHRKFMRMITVYLDITAPLYWWKEFDTYKVGTVVNSCSTMHKIHEKEFTLDDFSCEHLERFVEDTGGDVAPVYDFKRPLKFIIEQLNNARRLFLKTKDKKYWWQMIQLMPSSYNQRCTVMLKLLPNKVKNG